MGRYLRSLLFAFSPVGGYCIWLACGVLRYYMAILQDHKPSTYSYKRTERHTHSHIQYILRADEKPVDNDSHTHVPMAAQQWEWPLSPSQHIENHEPCRVFMCALVVAAAVAAAQHNTTTHIAAKSGGVQRAHIYDDIVHTHIRTLYELAHRVNFRL